MKGRKEEKEEERKEKRKTRHKREGIKGGRGYREQKRRKIKNTSDLWNEGKKGRERWIKRKEGIQRGGIAGFNKCAKVLAVYQQWLVLLCLAQFLP